MAITLACDHRILYGAQAARFLAATGELGAADMEPGVATGTIP